MYIPYWSVDSERRDDSDSLAFMTPWRVQVSGFFLPHFCGDVVSVISSYVGYSTLSTVGVFRFDDHMTDGAAWPHGDVSYGNHHING
jgi:hypothetical protein